MTLAFTHSPREKVVLRSWVRTASDISLSSVLHIWHLQRPRDLDLGALNFPVVSKCIQGRRLSITEEKGKNYKSFSGKESANEESLKSPLIERGWKLVLEETHASFYPNVPALDCKKLLWLLKNHHPQERDN